MPWQGHKDVLIDRFDGRAHLDFITEYKPDAGSESKDLADRAAGCGSRDIRDINYERYRILVQNDFLKSKAKGLGFRTRSFLRDCFFSLGGEVPSHN